MRSHDWIGLAWGISAERGRRPRHEANNGAETAEVLRLKRPKETERNNKL